MPSLVTKSSPALCHILSDVPSSYQDSVCSNSKTATSQCQPLLVSLAGQQLVELKNNERNEVAQGIITKVGIEKRIVNWKRQREIKQNKLGRQDWPSVFLTRRSLQAFFFFFSYASILWFCSSFYSIFLSFFFQSVFLWYDGSPVVPLWLVRSQNHTLFSNYLGYCSNERCLELKR